MNERRTATRRWSATVALLLLAATVDAQSLPILDHATDPVGGSTYLLIETGRWTDCQATALALGGTMVEVGDATENQFVIDTFGTPGRQMWIGLTDQSIEGTFEWESGAPVTFTSWAVGEPNDGNGADFAYYWPASGMLWDDTANTGANIFGLVEIAPCGVNAPSALVATSVGPDVELTFTNNGPYPDGIDVIRDGISLTTILDPAATSFTDLAACGGNRRYQLAGRDLGCYAYSETTEVSHGLTRFASTSGVLAIPNADPIGITDTLDFLDALTIVDVDVEVDITHTWLRDLDVSISSPAGTNVTLKEYTAGQTTDVDHINTTFDDDGLPYQEDLLPLGVRVQPEGPGLLADFNGETTQGTWGLTVIDNIGADAGTLNAWSVVHDDNGACPITEPVALATTVAGFDVTLDWDNGTNVYSRVEVLRDGAIIAELAGSPSSYLDPVGGPGIFRYSVRGYDESVVPCCEATSSAVAQAVQVEDLVWGAEGIDGDIDSADALIAALRQAGHDPVLVEDLIGCSCVADLEPGATIWIAAGTFPTMRCLTVEEGTVLVDHVTNGGNVYLEGGDAWGFCAVQPFFDVDGIDGTTADGTVIADGNDTLTALTGSAHASLDLTAFTGSYLQDQPIGSDWTDQLQPTGFSPALGIDLAGTNAGVIWQEGGGGYNVGNFY
ncbi:MAG: proprotein convertase P-domain-containing protein, partial [Planctomycetota bacterium]